MGISHYAAFLRALLFLDKPVYAHYGVTNRCDLKCKACTIWRRKDLSDELPLSDVEKLAKTLKELGCIHVSLGGGEPVLRDDLRDIIRIFNSNGLRIRVLTNGVAFTPERAKPLIKEGLKEVSFSLDTLDPDAQSYLDGVKDSFLKRMDNLFFIAKNLPRRNATPILNTMVTARNIDQLDNILSLAKSIGFYLSLIPIHLAKENGHPFFGKDKSLAFDHNFKRKLYDAFDLMIREKKQGAPILNSTAFLKQSPGFLLDGHSHWSCLAGNGYISISPNGMVAPCHKFEGDWDIHFSKFPKLSKTGKYQSELQEKIKNCQGCFRPCWTEISLLLTDMKSLYEMFLSQRGTKISRPSFDEKMVRKNLGIGG